MTPPAPPVLTAVAVLTAAAMHDVIARTIPNGWCAATACAGLGVRLIDHTLLGGLAAGAAVTLAAGGWRRAGLAGAT